MNLFVIGWSPERPIGAAEAEQALAAFANELPFFDGHVPLAWRAPSGRLVVASVAHAHGRAEGVRYMHVEDSRMALFSGRPFVWRRESETDGHAPLDARFYLEDVNRWSDALDGRCVAARYDDATSTLDLYTDPLGAYHLYAARCDGVDWFGNSAELVRALTRARAPNPLVIGSLVGCGWSLGGQPLWHGLRRLPRGTVSSLRAGAADTQRSLLPTGSLEPYFNGGFDREAAASTLVETVRGLASWPGRPSVVPVTGGRDSRIVFAAALRSGIAFEPRLLVGATGDSRGPEVQTAERVVNAVGRSLAVRRSRSAASVGEAARILRLTAPGTLSLDLAWAALNRPCGSGLPERDPDGLPFSLVHTGHGGELARLYYGEVRWAAGRQTEGALVGAIAAHLYRRAMHVWPRPPLSREGRRLVEEYLEGWVREQLEEGASPGHLPDLFYLFERMGNWVGASHGFDEYMADVTAPLWTPRLLPHEFGLPASDRARELFHFHVLSALAPELARVPFVGSNPRWPTFPETGAHSGGSAALLARRARREVRRRYEYRRRRASGIRRTPLDDAAALAREHAPAAQHEIWQALDRKGALALLARDAAGLDVRSARMAWRVATVLLTCSS